MAQEGLSRRCARARLRHPELGRAIPYGVYDIGDDAGWVRVGVDHDTGAFAVNAIGSWWTQMGRARYPNANSLLITADGGGSNGSAKTRRPTRARRHRLSLAAGHEQVEQGLSPRRGDRASPVLVHHHELARQAARHPSGDRSIDRRGDQQDGPRSALRTRFQRVSRWRQNLRPGIQRPEHHPPRSTAIGTTPSPQKPILCSVKFRSRPQRAKISARRV